IASIGGDAERQHVEYIHHINEALAGRPDAMNVTTHMCRGNFRSAWAAEGGYDFVAEALFGELEVDGFFMEWDDERSGGFEPLRFLPKGSKQVVLGLVTTKRGELESKDELKRRIEAAARYAPLEQLCLSPQCVFATLVDLFTPLPVMWKLSLADLSVTEIVYDPAGSVFTTVPFSRSVTKRPGPTVACRNLPVTTALEISFVKFGSVVMTPNSF